MARSMTLVEKIFFWIAVPIALVIVIFMETLSIVVNIFLRAISSLIIIRKKEK